MAAAPAALLVGVVVDSRTARGARAGSRGARAWRCAATASNPVLQLEVTSCFVVCPLCIAFVSLFFVRKMITLTQCAQCFVEIQHVEVILCLWCVYCDCVFDLYSCCD